MNMKENYMHLLLSKRKRNEGEKPQKLLEAKRATFLRGLHKQNQRCMTRKYMLNSRQLARQTMNIFINMKCIPLCSVSETVKE